MSYRNSERKTHDIDAMTTNAVAFARVMMLTTRRPRPRRRLPSSRVEDEERSVDILDESLSVSLWCVCLTSRVGRKSPDDDDDEVT